ncbi:MAG: sulfur oxidation c-type cytochrome SoxX [Sulfuritalea sp.]|nr:sulfur oxidation c-type cytochrome SoxX [Sulfuritalea sp.]
MKKINTPLLAISMSIAAVLAAGCATQQSHSMHQTSPEMIQKAFAAMKRDFHARAIATMDRLDTDKVQDVCNATGDVPPEEMAAKLEAEQTATLKLPADGNYMGDWKAGEKIAQSGRGMTWRDKKMEPEKNGGNCYNCHQISPQEVSYGTIGPSLLGFGKIRGNTAETQKYAYSKIYNSKAFNACSTMPRFGHVGALNEKQIKDLVALLVDPASPVNK